MESAAKRWMAINKAQTKAPSIFPSSFSGATYFVTFYWICVENNQLNWRHPKHTVLFQRMVVGVVVTVARTVQNKEERKQQLESLGM